MGASRRLAAVALALVLTVVLSACGGGKSGAGGKTSGHGSLLALRPVLGTSPPPCPAASLPLMKDGQTAECLRVGPPIVDERDVRTASYSYNLEQAQPEVSIVLGSTGAANLDDFAAGHIGQRLAIVAKGKLVSAPIVRTSSFVGRIVITGLSKADAEDLFQRLKQQSGG